MEDCIFCRIVSGQSPATIAYESDTACAFFDSSPASEYHTLVVPKRHVADLFEASEADVLGVMAATKAVVDLYRDRLGLRAVEIAINSGAAAQQAVFHLHVHIVPRHEGDGQDTHWTTHPEIRERFDALKARLT